MQRIVRRIESKYETRAILGKEVDAMILTISVIELSRWPQVKTWDILSVLNSNPRNVYESVVCGSSNEKFLFPGVVVVVSTS